MNQILKKEPAQLIAAVVGVLTGLTTFITTVLANVGPEAGWAQFGLVALATGLPMLQGLLTRQSVFSPDTVERVVGASGSPVPPDGGAYATQEEVALLNAQLRANYYTKSEIDGLLLGVTDPDIPNPEPEPEPEPEPPVTPPATDDEWPNDWYVDGGTAAAMVAADRARNYADISKDDVDAIDAVLAQDAQAIWLNNMQDVVNIFPKMKDAAARNQVMQLVSYNVPNRDGNTPESWSKGGASGVQSFCDFIDLLAHNLETSGVYAYVVLEPDALTQPEKLEDERITCLNYAMAKLAAVPRVRVHLDVGGANWRPAEEMVKRCNSLIWPKTDVGLVTNVSGYHGITPTFMYIDQIASALGRLYIIDTSRNGIDTLAEGWCNLWGKRQGPKAQLVDDVFDYTKASVHLPLIGALKLDHPYLGAFMHIKRAGESDGWCNEGPAAGQWFRWWAVEFANNTLEASNG